MLYLLMNQHTRYSKIRQSFAKIINAQQQNKLQHQIKLLKLIVIDFSKKYNKFQSQRKMRSEDIANYLIEIGSNERKLQYCRQILAQNSYFTPQAAFCLNSSQIKTTLLKAQLLELFRFTGLTSTQQQLELIYNYFQIDGKNCVTLQQFSNIVLPQDGSFQISNKKTEKYQLKYSLQKLLLQILDNQKSLERVYKFKINNGNENSKITFKKTTLDHLKSFLAAHGKYPNQNMLDQILKEILMNRGIDKRHKLIGQYILKFNQDNKKSLSQNNIEAKELKDVKNITKTANITNQALIINKRTQICTQMNKIPDISIKSTQKAGQSLAKKSISGQNKVDGSVQERIKSLMSSIKMKGNINNQKNNQSYKRDIKFTSQIQQNTKYANVQQFIPERKFSEIKIDQDYESKIQNNHKLKFALRKQVQEDDYSYKLSKYKKSKVLSQENNDSISFNGSSRDVFCSKYNRNLATQNKKQNERASKQITNKIIKNEKSKRIDYLKSLVGQGSAQKPKQVQTYRF